MLTLLKRLFRLEMGVSPWQALADYFAEKGVLWTSSLFGGGIVTYLAAITKWIDQFGPIAWAAAFFVGALSIAFLFNVIANINKKRISNLYASRAISASQINPMESSFEKLTLKVSDFFNPYYIPNENKRFHQCQIFGPAMIFSKGDAGIITRCKIISCQVVIAEPGPLVHVTVFENCSFTECILGDSNICYERWDL